MATTSPPNLRRRLTVPPWLIVLAFAAFLAAGLAVLGEPIGAAIVMAIPLVPFIMFAGLRGLAGERHFSALLAVIAIVALSGVFRFREYADKSIDFQIFIKLVAMCLILALSLRYFASIVRRLYLYGLAYWLALYGFLIFTATYSMAPVHALVATISLLGSFLFLCHLCVRYGPERMVEILVWAGFIMCAASIVVYFVLPGFGRMWDWHGNELVITSRLQGIFGTSNGAGASCANLAFLTAAWYLGQKGASRPLGFATLAMALFCVVASNNRMALGSLMLSVGVYFLVIGHFGRKLLLLASLGVLALVPVLLFPDVVFGLLARSGNAEEITSATGRSRIWAVVIEMFWLSPLLGFGYASSQYILPHHPDLFLAAAHCHNIYFEMLFSGGIVAFLLFLWCVLTTIILAVRVGAARELAMFSFFLFYGLTEPVIGGITSFALIMWQSVVVLLFHRAKQVELGMALQRPPFALATRPAQG